MTAPGERLVYYSLAAVGSAACERQWVQSIRSLRRYNGDIPVFLFVYGSLAAGTLAEAERHGVRVINGGDYATCFADLSWAAAQALVRNPTLHKVGSLRLCPTEAAGQVLFLDCDTFFFDDVDRLFERYQGHHFYAREEPGSSRSHYGYDRTYLDEAVLQGMERAEGLQPIPPYNSGVFMLNGGAWDHLRALAGDFLSYAWRLLLGQEYASPLGAAPEPAVSSLIRRHADEKDRRSRLPFPSSNAWILDEVALWLTLGRIPGLTHEVLDRADVAQNGEAVEIARAGPDRPILVHYYSGWEDRFFSHVAPL